MLKAVVLGGAGDMGSAVVAQLVKGEVFSQVVVADRRVEEAARVASGLGNSKIGVEKIDVNEKETVARVLQDAHVAVNCVGPFYRFCGKVIEEVVEAGVNYVDICDDYDGAAAALQFDDAARRQGVTAVTGLGWTPGLTNVCAKAGAYLMDVVREVNIAWVGTAADSKGLAVIEHVLHAISGRVPSFQDGSLVEVEPRTGTEIVEFPEPVGKIPCYHVGHPEPVTIPQFISGVRTVTLRGALTPLWVNQVGSFLVSLGLTKTPSRKRRTAGFLHAVEGVFRGGAQPISGFRVDVKGERAGASKHFVYTALGPMAQLTSLPAALGAEWLALGRIRVPGVRPPEGCVDTNEFLKELAQRGIRITSEEA